MSYSRIVGGSINKLTKGEHSFYSDGDISSISNNKISVQGDNGGVEMRSDPEQAPSGLLEEGVRVYLEFRPTSNWTGQEYGFDWMRQIDYVAKFGNGDRIIDDYGDTRPYKETISRQYRKRAADQTDWDESTKNYYQQWEDYYKALNVPYYEYTDSQTNQTYVLEEGINSYAGLYAPADDKYKELEALYGYESIRVQSGVRKCFNSFLSIYPQGKVTLSVVAELMSDDKPDSFKLKYDENYLKVSLIKEAELMGLQKNSKKLIHDAISIECIKEFDEKSNMTVEIYTVKDGKDRIAGKCTLWRNDAPNRKKVNVLTVRVKTIKKKSQENIEDPDKKKVEESLKSSEQEINNYSRQALIEIKDEDIFMLDLSGDPLFTTIPVNMGGYIYETFPANQIVAYYDSVAPPSRYTKLAEYLNTSLKKELKHRGLPEDKYDQYLKLYYLDQGLCKRIDSPFMFQMIGGYSDASNNCLCLDSGYTLPVVVHELLHTFNIPHSFINEYFSPNAKFCYDYQTTDNLIDYGDESRRKSTWKWQWEIANKSVNQDGSISPENPNNE